MTELRWTARGLQYRTLRPTWLASGAWGEPSDWSEWMDVPTIAAPEQEGVDAALPEGASSPRSTSDSPPSSTPVQGREWLVIENSMKRAVFAPDEARNSKPGYIPRDVAEPLLGRSLDGNVWFTREESELMRNHPEWRDDIEDEAPATPVQGREEALERMRKALIQARGALRQDAMINSHGEYFGTTVVALEDIEEALKSSSLPRGRK